MKTENKKYLAWALFMLPAFFWIIFLNVLAFVSFIEETDNFSLNDIPFLKTDLILVITSTSIAIIIYVLIIGKWNKREKQLQKALRNSGISQIDNLTPYEFEEWVARLLRADGYKANATKKTGDYGADVIAEKKGIKIAIQVKKFNQTVGIKAVQEVIGATTYYNCYEGWVITSSYGFTTAAHNLAQKHGVKLLNKNDLALMLNRLKNNNKIETESNLEENNKYEKIDLKNND